MSDTFDQYAKTYRVAVEQSVSFSGLKHDFFLEAKVRILNAFLDEHFDDSRRDALHALDVGCGTAAIHPYLTNTFARLSGADISANSIAKAKAQMAKNDYQAYDGSVLPYGENSFDFTFASCVLHHIEPLNWGGFLTQMRRVTKPGGAVCILEHNPYNPLTRLAVLRCPFDEDAILLNSGKCKNLMQKAGFQSVLSRHFLVFPSQNKTMLHLEGKLSGLPIGAQYAAFGTL